MTMRQGNLAHSCGNKTNHSYWKLMFILTGTLRNTRCEQHLMFISQGATSAGKKAVPDGRNNGRVEVGTFLLVG